MRIVETVVGIVLVVAGIAGWFLLPDRGEMVVLALVALGGWLIDMKTTAAFGTGVIDLIKGIRK